MSDKTTSQALLLAGADENLRKRAIALAALLGADNPTMLVEHNMARLVASPADENGNETLASIYQLAHAEYLNELAQIEELKAGIVQPGVDMGKVKDSHLLFALKNILGDVEK